MRGQSCANSGVGSAFPGDWSRLEVCGEMPLHGAFRHRQWTRHTGTTCSLWFRVLWMPLIGHRVFKEVLCEKGPSPNSKHAHTSRVFDNLCFSWLLPPTEVGLRADIWWVRWAGRLIYVDFSLFFMSQHYKPQQSHKYEFVLVHEAVIDSWGSLQVLSIGMGQLDTCSTKQTVFWMHTFTWIPFTTCTMPPFNLRVHMLAQST